MFPHTKDETSFTHKYLRMCDRLSRIMNSVSLHPNYMQELLSVIRFFKRWHDETEDKVKSCNSKDEKNALRRQFITVPIPTSIFINVLSVNGRVSVNNPIFPIRRFPRAMALE